MPKAIDNDHFRKLLLSFPDKAVELLYDRYYRSLVTLSRRLTRNKEASMDIVQDTFTHVWENHEQLGLYRDHSIQFYLVKVVRNKSISYYRQSLKLDPNVTYLKGGSPPDQESSTETKIIEQEMRTELRNLISTLPPREQEVVLLRIDQEMSPPEIASKLSVTLKAVERTITSANKRIRAYWNRKAN